VAIAASDGRSIIAPSIDRSSWVPWQSPSSPPT
jgi:hypothetical protein